MPPLSDQCPEAGTSARAVPTATRSLLRKLENWSTSVRHARGQLEFGSLSEDTDGNGKRHRVEVIDDVDSVLVRARHPDGRAVVALWIRRHGQGWKLDMAWRGRAPGELAPQRLTARELAAYVVDQELEAVAA